MTGVQTCALPICVRVPFIIKWPGKVPAGTITDVTGSFTDVLPSIASFCDAPLPGNRTLDGNDLSAVFTGKSKGIERQHPVFFFRYFNDPICMLRDGEWCLIGYETPIPFTERLNLREYAKFKPAPGEPRWSQWGFQENHMEKIPEIVPVYFELYNLEKDIGQLNNVAEDHPAKVEEMKTQMLLLRAEMIDEGGNWYANGITINESN